MSKKLFKSTAIISVMTLFSRISGLVRDVVMANILGPGALSDAFVVAFRIPNFLRRIFAEGAFSQAFVPVFSELTENNTQQAKQFVNASASILAVVTFFLSVLGVIFAPEIIGLLAPGFKQEPDKFAETVGALRLMFPYLFCISLVAMSAGVLNTLNRFAVPAVTPVLLNLCLITAMLFLTPFLSNAAQALSVGVLVAGFMQLFFQIPSLIKEGYFPSFKLDFKNNAVRRVSMLMLPTIFSVSVVQINLFVSMWLASNLETGSVSWLYYSDRLMEFPVGVFGIALATVVLPSLSKKHATGSSESFSAMMDWALRWVVMIAVPASLGLYLLATPLLATIFQHGEFAIRDVQKSALALEAIAIGVSGFIFIKVLAPGFFAQQDTKTPVKIAVVAVVVNIVMSFILVGSFKHVGLALSVSISAWVNALLLLTILMVRKSYRPQSGWLWYLLRVAVAVAAMGFCLQWLNAAPEVWFAQSTWQRIGSLSVLIAAAVLTYFIVLLLLGVRPKQLLLSPKHA